MKTLAVVGGQLLSKVVNNDSNIVLEPLLYVVNPLVLPSLSTIVTLVDIWPVKATLHRCGNCKVSVNCSSLSNTLSSIMATGKLPRVLLDGIVVVNV